jgi:hypothetical protein
VTKDAGLGANCRDILFGFKTFDGADYLWLSFRLAFCLTLVVTNKGTAFTISGSRKLTYWPSSINISREITIRSSIRRRQSTREQRSCGSPHISRPGTTNRRRNDMKENCPFSWCKLAWVLKNSVLLSGLLVIERGASEGVPAPSCTYAGSSAVVVFGWLRKRTSRLMFWAVAARKNCSLTNFNLRGRSRCRPMRPLSSANSASTFSRCRCACSYSGVFQPVPPVCTQPPAVTTTESFALKRMLG